MSPNLVERTVSTIESLRIVLKQYELCDEATKKAIRHQLYTRTGGFAKTLFKETKSLAADYTQLEQKLGMAPFVDDEIKIHVKGGVVTDVKLPSHMSYTVIDKD